MNALRPLVVAGSVSLASALRPKLAHCAAPPLQIGPASLGSDLILYGGFAGSALFASALRPRLSRCAAPPLQIGPASLGSDLILYGGFAGSVSLASALRPKLSRCAAPPLQIGPASLGSDLILYGGFAGAPGKARLSGRAPTIRSLIVTVDAALWRPFELLRTPGDTAPGEVVG